MSWLGLQLSCHRTKLTNCRHEISEVLVVVVLVLCLLAKHGKGLVRRRFGPVRSGPVIPHVTEPASLVSSRGS